ncbi:MAG: CAP domain-containing protein [Deltaproteobacteria bacterium]|nr:CAP domain-containing protein [Deltaproteobacteria bacterium]
MGDVLVPECVLDDDCLLVLEPLACDRVACTLEGRCVVLPDAGSPGCVTDPCGDETCDDDETCESCPEDCGACPSAVCADLVCEGGETCASCPADCGSCAQDCVVDGECAGAAGSETCMSCADDCKVDDVCGNGQCDAGESSTSCPPDCGPAVWPDAWTTFQDEVVRLMNVERAAGTDCPTGVKEVVPALTVSAGLERAAELHAWDLTFARYFSHTSCDLRTPWDRAAALGVSADAENIGWNYQTPVEVVATWMQSTQGHCNAIMSPNNTLVGVGFASVATPAITAMFK